MKFKSTRCANIWIRTRTITTIDRTVIGEEEKERARFHYQYSNLRSLQPKFKPSHKLNRSVLTKLERNYSNHKYQRREGRKFFKLYSKFQFFSLSPINQGSILTRIFNINIGIIIHRYRSKKISHLLSDQFKISCERLTESRRKLDRQKDPSRHFRFHSFASHQITYSDPLIQNISFPERNRPLLLNALKIQEEIGGRKESRFSQTAIIVRVPTVWFIRLRQAQSFLQMSSSHFRFNPTLPLICDRLPSNLVRLSMFKARSQKL